MCDVHESPPRDWEYDDAYYAGEESCGRAIINLHTKLKDARPGLRVVYMSWDPAAALEFGAWCRMTGCRLLAEAHPFYLMEYKPHLMKKEE